MINRISEDIKKALKNKEKDRLLVLRSLKSALKNREIELGRELSEEESIALFQSQVKKRQQAIELYVRGNRPELAEQEKKEIKIIESYLPKPLSPDEMEKEAEKVIAELEAKTMKDMGKVMKTLTAKLGSRADGKILSGIVRNKLSG